MIEGIILSEEKQILNSKGDIFHVLKKSSQGFRQFGEAYFSFVDYRSRKGWKRHKRITLNLVVPLGSIRFIIHDDRLNSKTRGEFQEIILSKDNYYRLTVPPLLWIAFEGVGKTKNLLLNIIDEEHNPSESDDVEISFFDYKW